MEFVLDIGNTCTKYFAFVEGAPIAQKVEEGHELLLLKEFVEAYSFTEGIYACVVKLSHEAKVRLTMLPFPIRRLNGLTPTPLQNKYKSPETLGADRLAAAVGAWMKYPLHPLLIIDAGSCITFDYVTDQGEYMGGNISIGVQARLKAIDRNFKGLPLVEVQGPQPLVGYDTQTALRAGAIEGVRHEILGYIRHFQDTHPNGIVVLTGGCCLYDRAMSAKNVFKDSFLVAKGLEQILRQWEKNEK